MAHDMDQPVHIRPIQWKEGLPITSFLSRQGHRAVRFGAQELTIGLQRHQSAGQRPEPERQRRPGRHAYHPAPPVQPTDRERLRLRIAHKRGIRPPSLQSHIAANAADRSMA